MIDRALVLLKRQYKKHKASFCEEQILHKLSKSMHNNKNNNYHFKIEERRRQVAFMLAQSITETEIAVQLDVDQSTISRDVKALKEMSQQFVFDLAKSDLAYYYKQCIY